MIASAPNSVKKNVVSCVSFQNGVSSSWSWENRKFMVFSLQESNEIHGGSGDQVNGGASVEDKIPTMEVAKIRRETHHPGKMLAASREYACFPQCEHVWMWRAEDH